MLWYRIIHFYYSFCINQIAIILVFISIRLLPFDEKFHFINWWWLLLTKFDLMIKRRCCHFLSLVFPLSICSYSSQSMLTLHNSSNLIVCSTFFAHTNQFLKIFWFWTDGSYSIRHAKKRQLIYKAKNFVSFIFRDVYFVH